MTLGIFNVPLHDEVWSEKSFLEETLEENFDESPWNIMHGKYLGNFPNLKIERFRQHLYERNGTALLMVAENPDSQNHGDFERYLKFITVYVCVSCI